MLHVLAGFIGIGLFAIMGNLANNEREIFERPLGKVIYWSMTLLSLYLMYWGWLRSWFSS